MTRTASARVAGATFLLYIVVGVTTMVLSSRIPDAEGTAARLAGMAAYASVVRLNMILGLVTGFIALTLAVALYGVTRNEDHELSLLAMCCRVCEGMGIVIPTLATLGLLAMANEPAQDSAGAHALAEFLFRVKGWNVSLSALFFAVGSTIFSWLLLRGRMIPASLAWLGVVASILLVIGLPLQLAGVLTGSMAMLMWIPMAAFEIPLGVWFLIRGVAEPVSHSG